jgi:hypothetical protein
MVFLHKKKTKSMVMPIFSCFSRFSYFSDFFSLEVQNISGRKTVFKNTENWLAVLINWQYCISIFLFMAQNYRFSL